MDQNNGKITQEEYQKLRKKKYFMSPSSLCVQEIKQKNKNNRRFNPNSNNQNNNNNNEYYDYNIKSEMQTNKFQSNSHFSNFEDSLY